MLRFLVRVATAFLGVLVLQARADAQCTVVPDGLDGGPCCTTVDPELPRLPKVVQDAYSICWRNCDVDSFSTCRAVWSNLKIIPFPPSGGLFTDPCGPILKRLRLLDASGGVKWHGRMNLTYSRTWLETTTSIPPVQYQVWRFLVNGNLRPTALAGSSPCPVPPCVSTFKNARFTGYIDYARDCATGGVEYAWMLTHSCDLIDHAPGFPRAGFFHPTRAYTFVGPSAGFAIGPIQPLAAGGTSLEAVRRVRLPAPGATGSVACEYEEVIDCGLDVEQELCLCGLPTDPMQYAISDLGLASACGTSIFTPGGPHLPGYVSMGLGSWTDPTKYPGLESLRWTTGGYDYFDPCVGLTRREVFFGVTTIGGFFASQILSIGVGFPLPLEFVDQGNSLRAGATIMNVPYRSDHLLNLNF